MPILALGFNVFSTYARVSSLAPAVFLQASHFFVQVLLFSVESLREKYFAVLSKYKTIDN